MGRPRKFDDGVVLDAVERTFHDRGYHATTLADLVESSKLHKGSLYSTFGDKHALFLAVLRRYAQRRIELLDNDMATAATPMDGLRAYLFRQAREAVGGRGCLLANSALEMLPGDSDVAEIVSCQQSLVQERLVDTLRRQWASEGSAAGRDAVPTAHYLFAMIEGLWELGRTTSDVTSLESIVEGVLRSLH